MDGTAPLQQLPHLEGADALKKLSRNRVRSLTELQNLPPAGRCAALQSAGLDNAQVGVCIDGWTI